MKLLLFALPLLFSPVFASAQCMNTGGFETPEWTTHASGNWTQSTSEGTWTATGSYVNGGVSNSGSNKYGMNSANDALVTPAYTDPCDLSFYMRTSSDPDNWVVAVQYSTSTSGPWTTLSTVTENGTGGLITDVYTQITVPVNLVGTYFFRFFMSSQSTGSAYLDDISLTCGCSSNTITTGAITGANFTVDCAGPTTDAGSVAFTSTGLFTAGNVYTAQLSDASGSFASPTNIGTFTSTANSGSIAITIPAGTPGGSGYLIRIVSDAPVVTGTSSAAFTITQLNTCSTPLPTSEGLIINEWSNGPGGNQEYYEFVVSGQCGRLADIRGYILDDNNGTFTAPAAYDGTASGIAQGHFRFTYDAQWAAIPVGSLIVVYNAQEPNAALPPDDPTDANNDSLYVVPHTYGSLFENCTAMPTSTSPDSIYTPCTYSTAAIGGWGPLSLRNSGDAIQVRNPDGTYYHGVSYGGSEMTGGPNNLKLFTGSGSNMCGWFNTGDFFDVSNWSSGTTPGNQTPGLPNNASNLAWLRLMRDTTQATCPIVLLPVEMMSFTGMASENGNRLWWTTATERNASHFSVERSTDGKTWESLGNVVAAGNSEVLQQYTFTDSHPETAVNYYRLTQYDLNGAENRFNELVSIDNRENSGARIVGRYNLMGQPVEASFKGVQLIIFDDGRTQKIFNL